MYALHQETVATDAVLGGTAGCAAASMIALLTRFGPCSQFVVLHESTGAVSATANKTEDVFPRYPETATSWSVGRSLILSSFGRGVIFSRFLGFLFMLASCRKELLEESRAKSRHRFGHALIHGALTCLRGGAPLPGALRAVCFVLAIFN